MAIEKNHFKASSRFDSEFSLGSRESMSSEEDVLRRRSSAVDSDDDDDDGFDDADSGVGSDDFDLLELGESGAEFCRVGNVTCSLPCELYDLPGLEDILSLGVWNECLSEEERLSLTKYLPDMDEYSFMHTLKELFEGGDFHFGSPMKRLFDMLKGGLCEPRVALYREGLNFVQRKRHYHLVRNYHNNMVSNLCQMRDAWMNCRGYSIEEKLRVLNIMKSQKRQMHENLDDVATESSEREESIGGLWIKRLNDVKLAQKKGRYTSHEVVDPGFEIPSRGRSLSLETSRYRKKNSKFARNATASKLHTAKESTAQLQSFYDSLDMNTNPYGRSGSHPLRNYDNLVIDDDVEDPVFGTGSRQDRIFRGAITDRSGLSMMDGKRDILRDGELGSSGFSRLPFKSKKISPANGRNRYVNPIPEAHAAKLPNMRNPYEFVKKGKYPGNVQLQAVGDKKVKSVKGQPIHRPMKGSLADFSDRAEVYQRSQMQEEALHMDPSFGFDESVGRYKKWRLGRYTSPELRTNLLQEKRKNILQNGRLDIEARKASRMVMKSEDTESDSSEQFDDGEDDDRLTQSRLAYCRPEINSSFPSLAKYVKDTKKLKALQTVTQENDRPLDVRAFSNNTSTFGEHLHMDGAQNYLLKAKQKGKISRNSPLNDFSAKVSEGSSISGLGKFEEDDKRSIVKPVKKVQLRQQVARKRKGVNLGDDQLELSADSNGQGRVGMNGRIRGRIKGNGGNSEVTLPGGNSGTKKRKPKESLEEIDRGDEDLDQQFDWEQPIGDSLSLKKKVKKKPATSAGLLDMETSEAPEAESKITEVETETRMQKKPFTLITPTVHTGFSFSIVHLLSAVRMAMINSRSEDGYEVGRSKEEQRNKCEVGTHEAPSAENMDVADGKDHSGDVPTLTVQEIVNRVRSNPGDPCILETQEPLQDLIRGVLKIFSSKTAPLGAKGWKPLVTYEKSTKSWFWIGPVSPSSSDSETAEEVTSPEAWGLPHKMLVKLVDAFANWLKNGQETLQQIGSLPAPPLSLMQCNLDEKERFRDLRAQKSLNTITPSTEEVRAYFRKEEVLRYSIPDRAFAYTAADGKKSIVAPLRRCGGKPTSKARDHFMLKRDRPPHVTILCLVRDAAARLPGSIGTRADVCTLIRDSQYIVEDVTDAQVNQVVSGALDRLHYERDPCVQFDSERKLWVYLHREREEEDFEDDGTSSTKKWKRPKKEAVEQSDQGAVTVAFHGAEDQPGSYMGSDLNAEPSCTDQDKGSDLANGQNVDCNACEDQPMVPDSIGLDYMEDKLFCQENSTNEDFDDETFVMDQPAELLSATLL